MIEAWTTAIRILTLRIRDYNKYAFCDLHVNIENVNDLHVVGGTSSSNIKTVA